MATSYNVYKNDGANGPVDYSTVVATTSSLAYTGAALAAPSDTTFAVRATDGVSEEQNIDCRVRIVVNASGIDVSAIPDPPSSLSAVPTASGGARVDWLHVPTANRPLPTVFKVWLTAGSTVNYAASPAATVAFSTRLYRFSAILSGLSDGVAYSVGVRAVNGTIVEGNTLRASVTGLASGPSAVTDLTGTPIYSP